MALLFISLLMCMMYSFVTIKNAEDIDPSTIYDTINENAYIYDPSGDKAVLSEHKDREIVRIEEVPDNLKNAIVAVEDRTFYKHHGVNYVRILGAIRDCLEGKGKIGGTSTITQQLARNVYLPKRKSERSIDRKLIEMWYAHKIEKSLTKEEILEAYLNVIYLGCGSYGVGEAAENYFSKEVSDLSLTECAALAALPQAPDAYALLSDEGEEMIEGSDLYLNDASKDRRGLVLQLMSEEGYISEEEAQNAEMELREFINPKQ